MKTIEIYCENNNQFKEYPLGTTLLEIAVDMGIEMQFPICGALVNNKVRELVFEVVKPKNICFIDYTHPDGKRIFTRSLFFILYAAVRELMPDAKLKIDHSISRGFYCELENTDTPLCDECIEKIKSRMKEIIAKDLPFERRGKQMEKVLAEYTEAGLNDKVQLYEGTGWLYAYVYYLGNHVNYFHGHLLPSTGYIMAFNLERFSGGLFLRLPSEEGHGQLQNFIHQDKFFQIFQQHKEWASILNMANVGSLNQLVRQKKEGEIIKISEALHEKNIAEIASTISLKDSKVKLVLIAGPSSSGKTTFSKRLAVQLAVCGIKSSQISLDNYFVNREHTPVDKFGNYDFETLEAIDIDFFNKQLIDLTEGKAVEIPKFSFQTGQRYFDSNIIQLRKNEVLIIEGIHGLNPDLLPIIDPSLTFKIFISALTSISIDDHNPISTTDNRLVRRLIRDFNYRGYSAIETIQRWPNVRIGEEKNIFPHQENADIMFNSALLYELAVLKKYAEPLLKSVPENQPAFAESLRLLKFLGYFKTIEDREIPPTSLIREFLGGSSFSYK
jgi:uridine kinase